MKKIQLNSWSRTGFAAAGALLLHACAPGQDTPTPKANLNLSHYVAVGDSYTAGLNAGGLTRNSQEYSFPNLLAQQFRSAAGGGEFTQPLLEPGTGSGYLTLADLPASGIPSTRRVPGAAVRSTVLLANACNITVDTLRLLTRSTTTGTLPQNMGLPGLLLSQIETAGLGNATTITGTGFNPYFERLLPAGSNRTYLDAVTDAASTATFFTYFQGLDDLMPYVRSGGQCGANAAPLPSITVMRNNAKKVLDRLTANGRPGIIARLPELTSLPFLRAGRGLELEARMQAVFGDTARIYIEDPLGFRSPQHITNNDYVLATVLPRIGRLTAVSVGGTTRMLPYGRDIRNPVRDADVLDNTEELSRINGVLSSYNNYLDALAQGYKMPILTAATKQSTLDLYLNLFNPIADAIAVGGVVYSPELVRGNFFSLDYYTLTPRGNALLANTFITAINSAYRANIPAIDVNSLPTTAN